MRPQTLPRKNLITSAIIALSIFLVGIFSALKDSPTRREGPAPVVQTEGTTALSTGGGKSSNATLANTPYSGLAASTSDTENLKKEFFAKYLAEGSRNIKETTFRDLIKQVDTKAFAPKHEVISLNISSDNSSEGVKAYVNAFGVIIKKHLKQRMDRSEDAVVKDTLTKKDASTRTELQLFAVAYKNFAKDLLTLQVPSTLAKAHLLIVNGYEGMGNGLLGLMNIHDDPVNGTAGYEAYMKYRLDVTKGYAMIVAAVANQHIAFTPNEPGYPFYWNTITSKAPTAK